MTTWEGYRASDGAVDFVGIEADDYGRALDFLADQLERRDIPAFVHQDVRGKLYLSTETDDYYLREQVGP